MGIAPVIDASIRFLRTNPELLAYARASAPGTGLSVDEILRDAVTRVREAAAVDSVGANTSSSILRKSPTFAGLVR